MTRILARTCWERDNAISQINAAGLVPASRFLSDRNAWLITIKENDMNPDHMPRNAARDEAPEWDGEGMPPVGVRAVSSGGELDVLAVDDNRHKAAVRWYDGELGVIGVGCIRSVRTPVQRAEDEVVEAMRQSVHSFPAASLKDACCREIYHAIRDGKIPGIKLEE